MEQTSQTQQIDRKAMTKKAISVAWPAMAESFFVTLAGMIDTMMVSAMGSYAVAAVGLTNQPKFIGLTLFFGINIAVSALVARRKGEQRRENANEVLLTALGLTTVLCAVISVIFVVFAPQIMQLAGSNADTHEAAVEYFQIIMGGTFFSVLTMVINAAQRGSGNTRLSMTTNLTSSIVNVFFNYLLIEGHLGFPAWPSYGTPSSSANLWARPGLRLLERMNRVTPARSRDSFQARTWAVGFRVA